MSGVRRVDFRFRCGHRGAANMRTELVTQIVRGAAKKLCADCLLQEQRRVAELEQKK